MSTLATRRTQAERSATTKTALLRAARELFAERGFAATSRDEIAELAGVTRGALYHHFDGKEAVLRAVVLEMEMELVERVAAAARAAPRGMDQLRAGCLAYLDACTEPAIRRIQLLEGPAVLGWEEIRELNASYSVDLLQPALAAAMNRPADDADVNITAHLLLGALNEAALLLATADEPRRVRRQVAATFSAFLDRLVA
jgi:AcrR family transcriptional regulator